MAKSVLIGIRVPAEVKHRWEQQADQEGRTLSNWIKHKMTQAVPSSKRPHHFKKVMG